MIQLFRTAAPGTVLTLSPHLTWEDEYGWTPNTQQVDYARDGTPHIELWPRKGGQPVTLRPARDDQGLLSRAQLDTLYAWASEPAAPLTLTLHDGIARAVLWRTPFIAASPAMGYSQQDADERWRVTLYFLIPELP